MMQSTATKIATKRTPVKPRREGAPRAKTSAQKAAPVKKAPKAIPAPPIPARPLAVGELTEVALADIAVGRRFRKDLGDIDGLARDIAEVGLLEPPIVDKAMRLVCGHRRTLAAQRLGLERIPVIVMDIEDPLLASVSEDAERKALTASEKYAVVEALRELAEDPKWRARAMGGRMEAAAGKGRLDEALAKHVGLSRETARKIRAVLDHARGDEGRFGDLAAAMDADGRIDRHYRTLQARLGRGDAEEVRAIVVEAGWTALLKVEGADLAKFVKGAGLAGRGGEGTLLLVPSPIRALVEAAAILNVAGYRWIDTLAGADGDGAAWLVGVLGRKSKLDLTVGELLGEACAQGAAQVREVLGTAYGASVLTVALGQEELA